ncbi:hypothetical protein E2C01_013293 [Portunus trituberculatus]|uniref:Uncharacterized protein n=1 Tax=Portunus trituberculatus TaxID=210409 RepID=A0A5B7DFV4_PORTR|nr:hypothetical protein [Portunus trituberculatus]
MSAIRTGWSGCRSMPSGASHLIHLHILLRQVSHITEELVFELAPYHRTPPAEHHQELHFIQHPGVLHRFKERFDVTGESRGSPYGRLGTAKFEFKSSSVHSVLRGHPTAKNEFRQAEIHRQYAKRRATTTSAPSLEGDILACLPEHEWME